MRRRTLLPATLLALLLITILHPFPCRGQSEGCFPGTTWVPQAEAGYGASYVAIDGGLLAYRQSANGSDFTLTISRMNGGIWKDSLTCVLNRWGNVSATATLGGQLCLIGDFEILDGLPYQTPGLVWNGTAFDRLPRLTGYISNGVEFRGELYACGRVVLPEGIFHVVRLHDGKWEGVIAAEAATGQNPSVTLLTVGDGRLYIGGSFERLNGVPALNVASFDGEQVQALGEGHASSATSLAWVGGDLYLSDVRQRDAWYWDGAAWHPVEALPGPWLGTQESLNALISCARDGWIYAVIALGPDTSSSKAIVRWNKSAAEQISGFAGHVGNIIGCADGVFASGPLVSSCDKPLGNLALLREDLGTVVGSLFIDWDGDCVPGASEHGMPRRIVRTSPGGYLAVTDGLGGFRLHAPSGHYRLTPLLPDGWGECGPPVEIDMPATGSTTATLGARAMFDLRQMDLSIVGGRARAGDDMVYTIRLENIGTIPTSGTVVLDIDDRLTDVTSDPPADRRSGARLEWDVRDLAPFTPVIITLRGRIPGDITPGVEICARTRFEPYKGVSLLQEAGDEYCTIMRNSHDPNVIGVWPGSETPEPFDLMRGDWLLTYAIRFQNCGNDTARRVVILDTLSADHDLTTLDPGASSAPYTLDIPARGVLRFTFDRINLPDSATDPKGSIGYVRYRVRLLKDLPPGRTIPNRASIYFDMNPPVGTNMVVSRIAVIAPASVPLEDPPVTVTPNPAWSQIAITIDEKIDGVAELRDLLGRLVASQKLEGGVGRIDVAALPSGIYFITVPGRGAAGHQQVTIRR